MTNSLTRQQINAISGAVENGADILSRSLAQELRGSHRQYPGLIDITKPQTYNGDPRESVPYFGAILTPTGHMVLALVRQRDELLAEVNRLRLIVDDMDHTDAQAEALHQKFQAHRRKAHRRTHE